MLRRDGGRGERGGFAVGGWRIRVSFLEEVGDIIAERGSSYGPPAKHWGKTAKMWTVLLSDSLIPGAVLTSSDVARCYIADKLVRDTHAIRRDNLLDIAGYAASLDRIRGLDRIIGHSDFPSHSSSAMSEDHADSSDPMC